MALETSENLSKCLLQLPKTSESNIAQKKKVQQQIKKIYHSHNGVDGYRNMTIYLECIGYSKFVASGF